MPGDPEGFFWFGDSGFFGGRDIFTPKKMGGDLLVIGESPPPTKQLNKGCSLKCT